MTIAAVEKMWSKSGGSISSEKADAFNTQFSFTDGYQVLLTSPGSETADEVILATGVPRIGDQYKAGIEAFCTSAKATKISPIFWIVDIGYQGQNFSDNGLVDVEWSDVTTTEPIDRDWNGAAIVTANGERIDGLTVDISDQVVIIRRKFQWINTAGISNYRRATNSDTFLGWPPGTARLVGFSAKNQFKYGAPQELWDVTARIQFREPYANTTAAQAWYKRWRHEGLMINNGTGGRPVRARDGNGQEVTRPVLLRSNGEQETNENNAYFVHSQVYGSLPYSSLGIV